MENKTEKITLSRNKKQNSRPSFRLYFDESLQKKLNNWQKQIQDNFKGLITVSLSEVCHAILSQSEEIVSEKTLIGIENIKLSTSLKFDLLSKRAKEAENQGLRKSFYEIINENPEIAGVSKNLKKRRRKNKKTISENTQTPLKIEVIDESS